MFDTYQNLFCQMKHAHNYHTCETKDRTWQACCQRNMNKNRLVKRVYGV